MCGMARFGRCGGGPWNIRGWPLRGAHMGPPVAGRRSAASGHGVGGGDDARGDDAGPGATPTRGGYVWIAGNVPVLGFATRRGHRTVAGCGFGLGISPRKRSSVNGMFLAPTGAVQEAGPL